MSTHVLNPQPYTVRVTVTDAETGSTVTRDYVRTNRMGRAAFAAFALGDLLLLTRSGDAGHALWTPISWTVEEVTS